MVQSEQIPSGIWTALVTPFDSNGNLDLKSFDRLLSLQMDAGITGVVIAGTTGESSTLSVQEKLTLIRRAHAQRVGSFQVMAGVCTSSTQQSLELAKLAEDAGADSLLIATPPYSKPTITGLIAHFEAIAKASKLPLCLYHVPSRTGQFLPASDIAKICSLPTVRAVKEASGDIGYFSRAKRLSQTRFFSGDDATFFASRAIGGAGIISVISNILPTEILQLDNAISKGNLELAQQLNDILAPLTEALSVETNPGPIKALLSEKLGLCNFLRLPLAPASQENQSLISSIFKKTTNDLSSLVN